MEEALLAILIALSFAYVAARILKVLGIPRVIGQICTGIIIAYSILRPLFFSPEVMPVIGAIANLGILLLFFFVGLELNFTKFKHGLTMSSFIAFFDTIVPFIMGFCASRYLFHLSTGPSIVIGITLSVCAEAIALDILEELKMLKTKLANIIITAATLDDIVELFLVAILFVFFGASVEKVSFSGFLQYAALFIAIILLFRVIIIPLLLRLVEGEKSSASLFTGALIILFLMAYLSSLMSIASVLGALAAGILVRQTLLTGKKQRPWEEHDIARSIHTVAFGFLIPIFFVYVGLNTDISFIRANLLMVLAFTLICIAGTILGTMFGVVLGKGSVKEGLMLGWAFIPKGDTELVIATIALGKGIITKEIYSVLIAVALITTLVATIAFRHLVLNKTLTWKTLMHK